MSATRILIVEDEIVSARSLENRLHNMGYEVAGVLTSGEAAVDFVDTHPVELVLMDIRLKGTMDGIRAAGAIRAKVDIPLIYLTAYSEDDTLQRAKATSPYSYLLKPVNPHELNIAIEIAILKHGMNRQLKTSEEKYRQLFEKMLDGFILFEVVRNADRQAVDLRFLEVNPSFERLTGYASIEVVGKTLVEVLPNIDPFWVEQFCRVGDGQGPLHFERYAQIVGKYMEVSAYSPNLSQVAVVFVDITQRKLAEEALNVFNRELEKRVREVNCLYAASKQLEQLETEISPGIDGVLDVIPGGFQYSNACCVRLVIPEETHTTPGFRETEWKIESQVVVRRQPYGILQAFYVEEKPECDIGPFLHQEQDLIDELALRIGNTIHRLSLHEEIERRLGYLSGLRTIDLAITGSFDLNVTMDILLGQLQALLEVDACCLLLFDAQNQCLDYVLGRGFRRNEPFQARIRLGDDYAGRVALERRMIQVPFPDEPELPPELVDIFRAEEFEAYIGVPLIDKGNIQGVLEVFHRAPLKVDVDWMDFLETLARQAAIAVDNSRMFEGLQRTNLDMRLAYDNTLVGWSRALELRDQKTEGHTQRAVDMTLELAKTFGISGDELANVRRGVLLHDIGKIAVPDGILNKPGALTESEWAVMRRHPEHAFEMLSPVNYLKPALDIPYCHHEKWDGSGYPRGLRGEAIPLAARIFAVVDVWDALRSDRPYREAWSDAQALDYIQEQAGKHFDPAVVERFLGLVRRASYPFNETEPGF